MFSWDSWKFNFNKEFFVSLYQYDTIIKEVQSVENSNSS